MKESGIQTAIEQYLQYLENQMIVLFAEKEVGDI